MSYTYPYSKTRALKEKRVAKKRTENFYLVHLLNFKIAGIFYTRANKRDSTIK